MRLFKSEAEVAAKVIEWLEGHGWETYKEVDLSGGGVADIVATKDKVIWIVETKTTLSTKLASQAYDRLPYAHYVSIASPRARNQDDRVIDFYCRTHGIGRIEVGHWGVSEELEARVKQLIEQKP